VHMYVKALARIASRYVPSRILSFNSVHVFKVLQLIENKGHVSRNLLCKELSLGEGSVKTLVKHLKAQGIIESTKAGTTITPKGKRISEQFFSAIPTEMSLSKCSVALGKFNYAVLLKQYGFALKSGIEQRDAAIRMGAIGATSLLFMHNSFVMPGTDYDPLTKEPDTTRLLLEKLKPEDGDAIVIGSDMEDERRAELAAKNAALTTIIAHERHNQM
jgi:predicted transcriptional regulator